MIARSRAGPSAFQMSARCLGATAVAFIAVVMSPLLLEGTTVCQIGSRTDYVEGDCPVKLTPVQLVGDSGYSERITVRVWMKADEELKQSPRIEIVSDISKIFRPTLVSWSARPATKKRTNSKKRYNGRTQRETRVTCDSGNSTSFVWWELVHDCVEADAGKAVSVRYTTTSKSCNVNYTVPDPMPDFDLSVNLSSKSITVTVEPGRKVYTRWCYQKSATDCMKGKARPPLLTIDPSQSRSALLSIPYLLPCVCVEAFYTYTDAHRHKKCPLQNQKQSLADVRDVWLSSEVTLFKSELVWRSECPASDLKISASLCWKQHEHLCTPVLNATQLEPRSAARHLIYNTSALDKHPRMCVQFSLQGSHNITCPFEADKSSWEVHSDPGRRSVLLHLTSSVPATFSAQLCLLNERGCTPVGEVHSVTMDGNSSDTRMNVPIYFVAERPCVQVWQSDPSLHGRRILCPDYTHNRWGMYAVAALTLVVIAALLGVLIHRLTKSGSAGWLFIQKPVLLVCSSEQSAHVSAVCALASLLQGELSATVHMALWALSSQTQAGAGAGVADLGPLPWLYGQWEAVRGAQGKALIVWSPEAKRTYETWREERENRVRGKRKKEDCSKAEVRHERATEMEEDLKPSGKRMGKCKKKKGAGKTDCVKLCDDEDSQRAPSTVIAPVFTAALACLEGALQGCKGQGVALVYFQGHCHSKDIPKALRGVPQYCLPQDFRGLIQELGGVRRQTKTDKLGWHCWPRLLSKVMSIWLARQLAQRLQTLLPQTQGKKVQNASLKMMSDKTQSRLKLPLAANATGPGTAQEHEPLHGSPRRAERLSSQVSRA